MKLSRWPLLRIFLIAGGVCGIFWWKFVDRWAYYENEPGHWQPKFAVSGSWLMVESMVAGVLGGLIVACLWARLQRKSPFRRPPS